MNEKREYSSHFLLLLMGGLLALLVLVFSVGSARAHYELSQEQAQRLRYDNTAAQVFILSAEKDETGTYITDTNGNIPAPAGWVAIEDAVLAPQYEFPFLLANGQKRIAAADDTQEVTLTLFATEGIADPESVTITLIDGGGSFVAKPTEVQYGSAWYETYGHGWTYRFYTGAGEELHWTLLGGRFSSREMKLTLSGPVEAVSLLTILISASPVAE